jgi:hypothetical protein
MTPFLSCQGEARAADREPQAGSESGQRAAGSGAAGSGQREAGQREAGSGKPKRERAVAAEGHHGSQTNQD